jgi:excisionase family DNA binding protein
MDRAKEPLLRTSEVAELLRIHPKQVYRLVRQGLPGRRVGGEWRFVRREVEAWVERGGSGATEPERVPEAGPDDAEPFLAANGDLAIEILLAMVNGKGTPILGFVGSDRDCALALLERRAVVAAGCHGKGPPARIGEARIARIHIVQREVGLVARGEEVPSPTELGGLRLAARPATAGIAIHLERALAKAGKKSRDAVSRATLLDSHRDVVCAILRGEADVGLTTRAWAARVGLAFRALAVESYGLLVMAGDLGKHPVVRLCEVAQSADYRRRLSEIPGYDPTGAGDIRYDPDPDDEP